MKPKKKLAYKLQSNVQQNPFKRVEQKNFRNNGNHSYDFAKLRSYRAFSLNSLHNDTNSMKINKNSSIEKETDLREQTKKYMIENVQTDKKLLYQSTISVKKKNIQLKNTLKQTNKRQKMQFYNQIDPDEQLNNKMIKQIVHQKLMMIKKKYQEKSNKSKKSQQNQGQTQKGIFAFPLIKNQTIQDIFKPFTNENNIEQLKAKQYLMKEINNMKQFQMNKKILQIIKQKSNKNLQRLARSQSLVLKSDKWKERYPMNSNKKQSYLKLQRNQTIKIGQLLPKIQSNYWSQTSSSNDDELQKSPQIYQNLQSQQKSYQQFYQTQILSKLKSNQNNKKTNYLEKMRALQQQLSLNHQKRLNKDTKNKKTKEQQERYQIRQTQYNKMKAKLSLKIQPSNSSFKRNKDNKSEFQTKKQVQKQQQNNDLIIKPELQFSNKNQFKTYKKQYCQTHVFNKKQQQVRTSINAQTVWKRSPQEQKIDQKQIQYSNRIFSKLIQEIPMQWESIPHQMLEEDYDFGQFQIQNKDSLKIKQEI